MVITSLNAGMRGRDSDFKKNVAPMTLKAPEAQAWCNESCRTLIASIKAFSVPRRIKADS
jgi:hypothetical protein